MIYKNTNIQMRHNIKTSTHEVGCKVQNVIVQSSVQDAYWNDKNVMCREVGEWPKWGDPTYPQVSRVMAVGKKLFLHLAVILRRDL